MPQGGSIKNVEAATVGKNPYCGPGRIPVHGLCHSSLEGGATPKAVNLSHFLPGVLLKS